MKNFIFEEKYLEYTDRKDVLKNENMHRKKCFVETTKSLLKQQKI